MHTIVQGLNRRDELELYELHKVLPCANCGHATAHHSPAFGIADPTTWRCGRCSTEQRCP